MEKITSHSLPETELIAEGWVALLSEGSAHAKGATVVGFSGHLGAGKTTFTKAVAKALWLKEDITSPTYVIMKIYELSRSSRWKRLIHIDAYRLESAQELKGLKFDELISDRDNLIIVEWPENVKEALTGIEGYQSLTFSIPEGMLDTTNREIVFN